MTSLARWLALAFVVAIDPCRAQELNIIAMGDWGAPPSNDSHFKRHARVAKALGKYVAEVGKQIDAVLLLGDNFYGRLSGVDDERWQKNFVEQFPPERFPMPFYFVFGNHDFEDGTRENWKHELAYTKLEHGDKRWQFPAKVEGETWYRLDLPKTQPLITFICLNSSKDWLNSKKYNPNADFRWPAQTDWVKAELAAPRTTPWLAGEAHYPLYTDGHHYGDDKPGSGDYDPWDGLQHELMPLFVQQKAQFWIAGHDHNLQHLRRKAAKDIDILISGGGGGDSIYGAKHKESGDFFETGPGWLHLTFTATKAAGVFLILDLAHGKKDPNGVDIPRQDGAFERTP